MFRSLVRRQSARAAAAAVLCAFASTALIAQAAPRATPAPPTAAPVAPAAAATPAYLASHAEAMAVGRATARAAFTGLVDSLVATADSATAANVDVRARVTDGVAQIALQLGAERRLVAERVMLVEGRVEYWRTAEYEMVPVPLVFRVILGAKGSWRGFTANTEDMTPAGEEVKP